MGNFERYYLCWILGNELFGVLFILDFRQRIYNPQPLSLPEKIDILVDCKTRIDIYVHKNHTYITSKYDIIRPLSLLLGELWPIYCLRDFTKRILIDDLMSYFLCWIFGNEFFEVFFMLDFS